MTESSLRGLESAARQWVKEGFKDEENAVGLAAGTFIKSAAARSKPGQKSRQVIPNPKYRRGNGRAKYLGVVLHQRGPKTFFPVKRGARKVRNKRDPGGLYVSSGGKTGDPRLKIRERGLARNSWGWMSAKLGEGQGRKTKTIAAYKGRTSSRVVRATKKRTRIAFSIRLQNALGYIVDAYPGIVQVAAKKATNSLNKQLRLKLDARAARFSRR